VLPLTPTPLRRTRAKSAAGPAHTACLQQPAEARDTPPADQLTHARAATPCDDLSAVCAAASPLAHLSYLTEAHIRPPPPRRREGAPLRQRARVSALRVQARSPPCATSVTEQSPCLLPLSRHCHPPASATLLPLPLPPPPQLPNPLPSGCMHVLLLARADGTLTRAQCKPAFAATPAPSPLVY